MLAGSLSDGAGLLRNTCRNGHAPAVVFCSNYVKKKRKKGGREGWEKKNLLFSSFSFRLVCGFSSTVRLQLTASRQAGRVPSGPAYCFFGSLSLSLSLFSPSHSLPPVIIMRSRSSPRPSISASMDDPRRPSSASLWRTFPSHFLSHNSSSSLFSLLYFIKFFVYIFLFF